LFLIPDVHVPFYAEQRDSRQAGIKIAVLKNFPIALRGAANLFQKIHI